MRLFLGLIVFGLGLGLWIGPMLPWWYLLALGVLLGALLAQTTWKALLAGFAAGVLVWLTASFVQYFSNGEVITQRMTELIGLGSSSLLFVLTTFLGGLTTALGSWSGAHLRKVFVTQPTRRRMF